MSYPKKRIPGKTPPIVLVFMVGFILILVVLAIALSGGGGSSFSPARRDNPQVVNNRVLEAMQKQDSKSLFDEIAPDLQNVFPLDAFQKAQQNSIAALGNVIKVEMIQPPAILTGQEWNNQWAEALVRITREKDSKDYIVRYYQENGEWYLVGTIEK